jgi:isocitrate/isopropylmalate dehydrogenase
MTVPAKQATVVLLPGDGVGPEVIAEAQRVLELVAKVRAHKVNISFKTELIGGASIDAHGKSLLLFTVSISLFSLVLWGVDKATLCAWIMGRTHVVHFLSER